MYKACRGRLQVQDSRLSTAAYRSQPSVLDNFLLLIYTLNILFSIDMMSRGTKGKPFLGFTGGWLTFWLTVCAT